MDFNLEQKKWDDIYSQPQAAEESPFMRKFNDELVETITELLPDGGESLEAGSGGGWQSLALARSGLFRVTLMDFSSQALNYSKTIFENAGISATFKSGNIFNPPEDKYDIVFNAGVIEHYPYARQVDMVSALAKQSRRFVLVLAPNLYCYWYWVWRFQQKVADQWSYGTENPISDFSTIFRNAGLNFLGQRFLASTWTEEFITALDNLDEGLRNRLLAIHRDKFIPTAQKSYLIAGLGTIDPSEQLLFPGWLNSAENHVTSVEELTSSLADISASKVATEMILNKKNLDLADLNTQIEFQKKEVIQWQDNYRTLNSMFDDLKQQSHGFQSHLLEERNIHQEQLEFQKQEAIQWQEKYTALNSMFIDLQQQSEKLQTHLLKERNKNQKQQERILDFQNQIVKYQAEIQQHISNLEKLKAEFQANEAIPNKRIDSMSAELAEIHRSRAWRLIQLLWKIRLKVFPPNSFQVKFTRKIVELFLKSPQIFKKGITNTISFVTPPSWKIVYRNIKKEMPLIDNSEVLVFTSHMRPTGKNSDVYLQDNDLHLKKNKVSLITTCLNEKSNVESWFNSLVNQTRLPDELVIVDGGSSDDTVEILKQHAQRSPFPVRIIEKAGVNIASGRNIAIQNAAYDLVACSDLGSKVSPEWLRYLIAPFEIDPLVQVTYGCSSPAKNGEAYTKYFTQKAENISPQHYLPSSRTISFNKSLWAKIGGYPEWLKDAGEDTYFDILLKKESIRCAFVPDAVVEWYSPKTLSKVLKTVRRYSFGDGETGVFATNYWIKIKKNLKLFTWLLLFGIINITLILTGNGLWIGLAYIILIMVAWLFGLIKGKRPLRILKESFTLRLISLFQVIGFVMGVVNRPKAVERYASLLQNELHSILEQHKNTKGIIVYLPTHDWSFMFQRPQQMARAFSRQGYLYFYCTNNEKSDSVNTFFEVEENVILSHVPVETFSYLRSPIVYIGAPFHGSLLRIFDHPFVIYDHYDDLEVSSSRKEDHEKLLQEADIVITSAERLLLPVQAVRPDVISISNGVDYEHFSEIRRYPALIPQDLTEIIKLNKPIIGYSGALASWFDYELLEQVAILRPEYEIVLVGVNYDGSLDASRILSTPNIHWLGMKKYEDVGDYLLCFSVAIIPFKINSITLSTSPIKMYEYAACHKPIVTTPLPECIKQKVVHIAHSPIDFANAIDTALTKVNDLAHIQALDELAKNNSWQSRVDQIIPYLVKR